MLVDIEGKASLFLCLGSQFYIIYAVMYKRALEKLLQIEYVTIPGFTVLFGMFIGSMRRPDGKIALVCTIMVLQISLVHLLKTLYLLHTLRFCQLAQCYLFNR